MAEWLAAFGNNRECKPRKAKPSKAKPSQEADKPKRTDLSDNTVRRRTGIAKQFFNYAKAELLTKNPFVGLPSSVQVMKRSSTSLQTTSSTRMIDACNGAECEAVIALSDRWAALPV